MACRSCQQARRGLRGAAAKKLAQEAIKWRERQALNSKKQSGVIKNLNTEKTTT